MAKTKLLGPLALALAVAAAAATFLLPLPRRGGREGFQPGNLSSVVVTLYSESAPPKDFAFDVGGYLGDRGLLLARAKGAYDDASTTTDEAKRLARQLETLALAAYAGNAPEFAALTRAVQEYLAKNGQYAIPKKAPAPPMDATNWVPNLVPVPVCAKAQHPPAAVYGTINAPVAHLADRGYVAWS